MSDEQDPEEAQAKCDRPAAASDYTPSTEAVRLGYAYVSSLPKGERHFPPLMAEFDRWLIAHDAEKHEELATKIAQYSSVIAHAAAALNDPTDPQETRARDALAILGGL